jgi:hypothetical protein
VGKSHIYWASIKKLYYIGTYCTFYPSSFQSKFKSELSIYFCSVVSKKAKIYHYQSKKCFLKICTLPEFAHCSLKGKGNISCSYRFPVCSVTGDSTILGNTTYVQYSLSKSPWPESASGLYRPSDRRLSAKLVPTFTDRGCSVVIVSDPYGRILSF